MSTEFKHSEKLMSILRGVEASHKQHDYPGKKKSIIRQIRKEYDISPQDIYDLLHVGKAVYSQGAGLTYEQVADILSEDE